LACLLRHSLAFWRAWRVGKSLCALCCGLFDCTHGFWRAKLTAKDLLGKACTCACDGSDGATDCACSKGQSGFACANKFINHPRLLGQWCVLLLESGCVFFALGKLVGLRHGVEFRSSAFGRILDDPSCVFVGCCHLAASTQNGVSL
jgi:hypothetical protein